MNPSAFVHKWNTADLNEIAAFQTYFNDLCELVGHDPPVVADPSGEDFQFEKFVIKAGGGQGRIDVAYRGKFIWEHKSRGEDLDTAYDQALSYSPNFDSPPLIVVGDFDRIIIHTDFTCTKHKRYEITLAELQKKIRILESLFHAPEELKPGSVQLNSLNRPRIKIELEPIQSVRVWSSFGQFHYLGQRAPILSGLSEYKVTLVNSSYRTARLITIRATIEVTVLNRPELKRVFNPNYEYLSTQHTYCLPHDKQVLDSLSFEIEAPSEGLLEHEDLLRQLEDECAKTGKTSDENLYIRAKLEALKGNRSLTVPKTYFNSVQRTLLKRYLCNPAKDLYTLTYKVKAEGFDLHESTIQFEILWNKVDRDT